MSSARQKMQDAIPAIRFNPSAIVRRSLAMVEEMVQGTYDIVNPTSPFMMLMEGSATLAAAAMIDGEALLRKQYESMAITEDELYLHMSDKDYLNRFATPARATLSLLLGREDIYRYAEASEVGEYRKIVIPKHTEFMAADLAFTLQYAIEIRIKQHGGLEVVYDNSTLSPIERLSSNLVDYRYVNISDIDFLMLNLPVSQFQIESHPNQLTLATNYQKTFTFSNQYYYARVYRTDAQGTWVEMQTTHTQQVFDPYVPTAVLKVDGQQLTVSIPQVYLTQQFLTRELRIDIYTTLGVMDRDLSSLTPNAYTITWRDLDGQTNPLYSAALPNMMQTIFSNGAVVGGSNRKSFTELRNRVMENAVGSGNLPITNAQVTTYLQDLGYDSVVDVDHITNRKFLATRLLPVPTDGTVISSAGLAVETLMFTAESLATVSTVANNGERMTLLPTTVYENDNGVTKIVGHSVIEALLALPFDERALRLNDLNLTFSPFHYVLDMTQARFETRPYYLQAPKITDKSFIAENDTLGIVVGTGRYSIEKTETGYRLTLQTKSDQSWKTLGDDQVFCQIAFRPYEESDLAYMNGTLIGILDSERVFQFDIGTQYDIDQTHHLALTSFHMYNDPPRPHFTGLDATVFVMYAVNQTVAGKSNSSNIDLDLDQSSLPVGTLGVSEETLSIQFGVSLEGLWVSSRSLPSSLDYKRSIVDVPAVYTTTVYETDATGAKVYDIVDGQIVFRVLHAPGDPILDQNGQPTYLYRAGDVLFDANGEPIVENSRKMLRQTDLVTVDGKYYFVTDQTAVKYREGLAGLIAQWVGVDIKNVSRVLIEQSELFFYPKVTYGMVSAIVMENKQVMLSSHQMFNVFYYVTNSVYRDIELRNALTVSARVAINKVLSQRVVTVDQLIQQIKTLAGEDVIGVNVTGLGGQTPYDVITLLDDAKRLSIAKRTVAYADGTIGVEDAVNVTFVLHTPS